MFMYCYKKSKYFLCCLVMGLVLLDKVYAQGDVNYRLINASGNNVNTQNIDFGTVFSGNIITNSPILLKLTGVSRPGYITPVLGGSCRIGRTQIPVSDVEIFINGGSQISIIEALADYFQLTMRIDLPDNVFGHLDCRLFQLDIVCTDVNNGDC